MSAAKYDLTIDQGSDFQITLNIKEDGVNKDLTGWSARGQLRETLESDVAAEFNFGLTAYNTSGNLIAKIEAPDTGNLAAGQYFYDIEIYTDLSNVAGYRDGNGVFQEYSAAELADIQTFVLQLIVGGATISDERAHLFDMNGNGSFDTGDARAIILQAGSRGDTFFNAFNTAYESNQSTDPVSYQTNIITTLTTGSVMLQNDDTALQYGTRELSTRILQGKVNVTRQVTR